MLLERERNRLNMLFKIVLVIHDATLLEVPYHEVQEAQRVLKYCMSDAVEVPGVGLHYGADMGLYLRWNEKLEDPEILKQCGFGGKSE